MPTHTIYLDTETERIRPGCLAPPLVCMAYHGGEATKVATLQHWSEVEPTLRGWLTGGTDLLIGHNMAFDMCVLAAQFPDLLEPIWDAYHTGRVRDTMLRCQLIAIEEGWFGHPQSKFSLDWLCQRYLGTGKIEEESAWRLRFGELRHLPIAEWPVLAVQYAKGDTDLTRALWQEVAHFPLDPDEEVRQNQNAFALQLSSCWGLFTDQPRAKALQRDLQGKMAGLEAQLTQQGLLRGCSCHKVPHTKTCRLGSKDMTVIRTAVASAFPGPEVVRGVDEDGYQILAPKDLPLTEKFQVATDAETLKAAAARLPSATTKHPLVALAERNKVEKILGTFVDHIVGNPVINPNYKCLVESGRTSSYATKDKATGVMIGMNIQQLPREGGVRELFIPRPGKVLLSADYNIAELCALAEVLEHLFGAGTSQLAQDIRNGLDPHKVVAADLLSVTYPEVLQMLAEPKDSERYKLAKEMRQLAKALNFGLPGGLGAESFVGFAAGYGVVITVERAQQLKALWLRRYPEMQQYFAHFATLSQESGDCFSVTQLYSNRVRGGLHYCNGCNTSFQGLVADGAKQAFYEVSRQCFITGGTLRGARPVGFIHDEIILEGLESHGEELCRIMRDVMGRWIRSVPVGVDFKVMDRWTKE